MTSTILLDLDNTLLSNDMQDFLPPYFAALQQRLRRLLGAQNLQQLMYASVQAMQANQDPTVTNMAAFMIDFVERVRASVEEIQPILDDFYRQDYPHLRRYTRPRPEASRIVQRLLSDGYQVVIATNPLFPATAIKQRIAWAGISDFSYALVTTMENSHFSKPNPRYYEEILIKTNSLPETAWMVGDDPFNDIVPARSVGLSTWWITDAVGAAEASIETDRQGSLTDFLTWLEAGGLD